MPNNPFVGAMGQNPELMRMLQQYMPGSSMQPAPFQTGRTPQPYAPAPGPAPAPAPAPSPQGAPSGQPSQGQPMSERWQMLQKAGMAALQKPPQDRAPEDWAAIDAYTRYPKEEVAKAESMWKGIQKAKQFQAKKEQA